MMCRESPDIFVQVVFQVPRSAAWLFESRVSFPKGVDASRAQWFCLSGVGLHPILLQAVSLKSCLSSVWEHLPDISD